MSHLPEIPVLVFVKLPSVEDLDHDKKLRDRIDAYLVIVDDGSSRIRSA